MIGGRYGYCDLVDTGSVYIRYFEAQDTVSPSLCTFRN